MPVQLWQRSPLFAWAPIKSKLRFGIDFHLPQPHLSKKDWWFLAPNVYLSSFESIITVGFSMYQHETDTFAIASGATDTYPFMFERSHLFFAPKHHCLFAYLKLSWQAEMYGIYTKGTVNLYCIQAFGYQNDFQSWHTWWDSIRADRSSWSNADFLK